jgi:hypothetical protein
VIRVTRHRRESDPDAAIARRMALTPERVLHHDGTRETVSEINLET